MYLPMSVCRFFIFSNGISQYSAVPEHYCGRIYIHTFIYYRYVVILFRNVEGNVSYSYNRAQNTAFLIHKYSQLQKLKLNHVSLCLI